MIYNFSAGPAVLPSAVLNEARDEMLNWHESGLSVMEMSHRGPEFGEILAHAQQDLRDLLGVPPHYHILFMQGGAVAENAIIPMNLAQKSSASPAILDYVCTGTWSLKSMQEARQYGEVNVVADARQMSKTGAFTSIPDETSWQLSKNAAYVHICTNETIVGVEYHFVPKVLAPLVADMSSHILSRVINVDDYGVIYAGAQKNMGPAGLTVVIVRDDLLGQALSICPSAFNWTLVASHHSMFNTPPTYAIYIAGLVFRWLKNQGGVKAIEAINIQKASLLYDAIDRSGFYHNGVEKNCRSRMNVPFALADETLNEIFLKEAKVNGLIQLKGHSSVGGMRASLYNAMPIEGVVALVDFMHDFEKRYG